MKGPFPWGRSVAAVLAVVAVAIAVRFSVRWWRIRTECADARTTVLAVLPGALGSDGTAETGFSPKYDFTCKEMLIVEHDLGNRPRDEVMAAFAGLRAHLAIVDSTGKAVLEGELTDESFRPFPTEEGSNSLLLAFVFNPVRPGRYRLRLTVQQPAKALAGRRHRVVARYLLCGIEDLATAFTGGIAFAAALTSAALAAGIVVTTRRKRRHCDQALENPGA